MSYLTDKLRTSICYLDHLSIRVVGKLADFRSEAGLHPGQIVDLSHGYTEIHNHSHSHTVTGITSRIDYPGASGKKKPIINMAGKVIETTLEKDILTCELLLNS